MVDLATAARDRWSGPPGSMSGTEPMRVMHVVDSLWPGGTERMATELAVMLEGPHTKVSFCSTRAEGLLKGNLPPAMPYICLHRQNRWDLRGISRFLEFTRTEQVQLIHSHGVTSTQFVMLARALSGIRIAQVFHNHSGKYNESVPAPPQLRALARWGVDAYVGPSEKVCDWARAQLRLPSEKVFLVRNGIDMERFRDVTPADLRSLFNLSSGCVPLAMVANLRPEKGHLTLFKALAACRNRERIRVICIGRPARESAGPEYEKALEVSMSELGIRENLIFAGERSDVPSLLASCWGGILTSQHESGPLALIEYLASGLPWVVSDTGEVTRAVAKSGTGATFLPGDSVRLAKALDDLCELTQQARAALSLRAQEIAHSEFNQQDGARKIADLYRQLLRSSRT